MGILTKFLGYTRSRELKKLWRYVEEVNSYEERMEQLKDEEFPGYTGQLQARLQEGEDLMDLLPEAFALVREAARRQLGMRPFDVQVLGGVVLHQGRIAEMKTGEGKTLAATMPAYLNALSGKGVHIVTVNDYLARRDRDWMGPVYRMLGLSLGLIVQGLKPEERREAYHADITYGTNNEFGFDYLRDNMVLYKENLAQRPLHYAIVDEVDSILVDEARTPLIISGTPEKETGIFARWLKPVEFVMKKQERLVKDLLNEAEAAKKAGKMERVGELLYLARLGAPKNSKLLELFKEPGVSKAVEREKHALSDSQKQAIKEQLYFTIDESSGVVDIHSMGYDILVEEEPVLKKFHSYDHEKDDAHDEDEDEQGQGTEATGELLEIRQQGAEHESIIRTLLKAYSFFKKDVDYVVKDGEVTIVDEFTGRLMHGRRYSEGLHQAIEAKEGVTVRGRTQTIASITFQNYFRMYEKLSGMTGTALTEEEEFQKIYSMDVVEIPTNAEMIRQDLADVVYQTERAKFHAVIEEIVQRHEAGQPVLVGTISIERSELLSRMLSKRGILHHVLNAKHHEKEAEIVAQAGQEGAVTIATNMAGRGTDIVLGGNPEPEMEAVRSHPDLHEAEKKRRLEEIRERWKARHDRVVALGGLHIIGTERHESRRIDNQLRGRSGRQGDPGSSQFFVSMEDDLMRLFGSDSARGIMEKLGMEEDMPVEHGMISRTIENAQKKVESRNFEIRKHILEYDDVLNQQREIIYRQRRQVLQGENLQENILGMIEDLIAGAVSQFADESLDEDYWDLEGLLGFLERIFLPPGRISVNALKELSSEEIQERLLETARELYAAREEELGSEVMRELERVVLLRNVDRKWMDHIDAMHDLRQGVGLRSYGQQNPLVEYKKESHDMFHEMIRSLREDVVRLLFHLKVTEAPQRQQVVASKQEGLAQVAGAMGQGYSTQSSQAGSDRPQPVTVQKVGRNAPCPCGSGKKHKKCCGAGT